MAAWTFSGTPDDFGFLTRNIDDVSFCKTHADTCAVIDDAVIYAKMVGQGGLNTLVAELAQPFPNTVPPIPQGQLPAFYRALIGIQRMKTLAGRGPTLKELAYIIDAAADSRGREDDYYLTDVLVRSIVAPTTLSPEEKAWAAQRATALEGAKSTGVGIYVAAAAGAVLAILGR
jgi:hypothetical protein